MDLGRQPTRESVYESGVGKHHPKRRMRATQILCVLADKWHRADLEAPSEQIDRVVALASDGVKDFGRCRYHGPANRAHGQRPEYRVSAIGILQVPEFRQVCRHRPGEKM